MTNNLNKRVATFENQFYGADSPSPLSRRCWQRLGYAGGGANFSDVLAHQPQHIRPALFTRSRNDEGAHLNISSSQGLI